MPVHLLPATRRVLLLSVSTFAATNLICTAALLAYSLKYTAVSPRRPPRSPSKQPD